MNIPNASITSDSVYFNSNAFTAEATISIRFKQKYISMPNKKIITGSKYPRISITYKKAIPVFFSKINFEYNKSDSLINVAFNSTNEIEYGNLLLNTKNDGSDYSIKLPFEDLNFNNFFENSAAQFINKLVFQGSDETYTVLNMGEESENRNNLTLKVTSKNQ